MTSLNPVYTVGDQIAEVIAPAREAHRASRPWTAPSRCCGWSTSPTRQRRVHDYPHQFSGGMRQRVMIAMALSCKPKLLIADEPTTALDVTIQAQILELMQEMKERLGMAIMLITHAMGVVAETAQRVVVMYAGKVVEEAPVERAVRQSAPSLHAGPDPLDPARRPQRRPHRRGSRRSPARCRACSTRRRAAASPRAAATSCRCLHAGDAAAQGSGARPQGGVHPVSNTVTEPCCPSATSSKHFAVKGGVLVARGRPGACRRRRELRHRRRRDAGPGGRIGLRQVDHRPLHPAADRAQLGRGLVRGRRRDAAGRRRRCARCAATCRSSSRTPTPRSIRA